MKKYLLTGLAILLPFVLTIAIIVYLFDLFTEPFLGIVQSIFPNERISIFISRLIVFALLVLLIFILGFFARKFFFRALLNWSNALFSRIPFIKGIYKLTKDVTNAMFTEGKKTFKETVLIPFPSGDSHALGFITGEIPERLKQVLSETEVSVFVPTAPQPISGFLLLSPRKFLHPVDITTEETFKFLLSCGTFHPGEEPKE